MQCLNCEADLRGPYCGQCGQARVKRLSSRTLIRELPGRAFNLERGIVHTFVQMWLSPGRVARHYIDGRRRRYLNPLTYYLIAASAQLLALWWMSEDLAVMIRAGLSETAIAELQAAGVQDPLTWVPERYVLLIQNAYTWLGLITFVLPMTLVLRMTLGNKGNTAEMAVFSLFVLSHVILVTAILAPLTTQISFQLHSVVAAGLYVLFSVWAAVVCFGASLRVCCSAFLAIGAAYLSFLTTLRTGNGLIRYPDWPERLVTTLTASFS